MASGIARQARVERLSAEERSIVDGLADNP
jgi:hypothetical protein